MPDMGFPHDRHDPPSRPPRDWNEALTALPPDTPDSDGWTRLAARLPIAGGDHARSAAVPPAATGAATRTAPARRPLAWLAMAAALAAVVAVPLQWLERAGHDDALPPASGPATASADPATARPAPAGDRAARPSATQVTTAHEPESAEGHALAAGDTATASATRSAPGGHARGKRGAADAAASTGSSAPRSASVPPRQDTRVARASVPSQGTGIGTGIGTGDTSTASGDTAAAGHADDGVAATGPAIRPGEAASAVAGADADLERLYAESARLEALVAIARDDSMASASATLLTASLDERIGRIDRALSQSGLDRDRRLRLWQSRIDTLHELAGVETTQRWLSARGESWDTALVQVD